jgi:hypothetical protein
VVEGVLDKPSRMNLRMEEQVEVWYFWWPIKLLILVSLPLMVGLEEMAEFMVVLEVEVLEDSLSSKDQILTLSLKFCPRPMEELEAHLVEVEEAEEVVVLL